MLGLLGSAPAARAGHPSPTDWRDVVLYQVITDRFANGDTFNDNVEGNFGAADPYGVHGGDFDGIRDRLDYLEHLGVNAIWISPVVLNAWGEFHGYAARDFFSIAPHMGTLAELQQLATECHARGIYVVVDVVVNHMGDLVDSGSPGYPAYDATGSYVLRWRNAGRRHAPPFDNLAWFHRNGHIGNFGDPEQILGELSGLDDLKTEDPTVRAKLIEAGQWLVTNVDCDGFRVDTVKHTEMALWSAWCPAIRSHAAGLGKANFLQFGEAFDGSDAKVGSYTGTVGGGAYKFDSMLHYPMFYTTTAVFAFDQAPNAVAQRYTSGLPSYDVTTREHLVTFLDNHDNARFLSFGVADQDASRLQAALGWQMTSRGVPCLYYGTEQEFDGGTDPYDREDMFDGQWDFGPSEGDNFDLAQPQFRFTRDLIAARMRHPALRQGATLDVYNDPGGPGLLIYRRLLAGVDTAMVCVNTLEEPRLRSIASPWPAGTRLVDTLDPSQTDSVATSSLVARVPARSTRVYVSRAAWTTAMAGAPLLVEAIAPGHDQRTFDLHRPLSIVFDRAVDPATLAAGFVISPPAAGHWQVTGATARYLPHGPWLGGTRYDWSLAGGPGGVADFAARPLKARFAAHFVTSGVATGIGVPAGYVVDRVARQGLTEPEGVITAGPRGPLAVLVSDASRQRLFTLTSGGDLGHWLGDRRWTRPEGIATHDSDGRTAILAPEGLFEADSLRWVTLRASSAITPVGGGIAWGGPAFLDRVFIGDLPGNRILRFEGATFSTFATGINGAEALAFGPGGAWGTNLYVADANLTSLGAPGASSNGLGRLVVVDAAGAVTGFVTDPALLGASGLAFDRPDGAFGGDLFVGDVLQERVLRVSPGGAVSVFATGFGDLTGSSCVAIGPDGALYVADHGDGGGGGQVLRIAASAFVTDAPDAGAGAGAPPISFAAPAPNPSPGAVTFTFDLARAAPDARLTLFDVAGRQVRDVLAGPLPAGRHAARWDGLDDRGRRAPAGLYFARLTAGRETATRRVVLTP
ncbi:MAG: alpha-amylase family glycosyl hydrolase [Candidatus Eisenbacteria bacterium]